MSLQFNVDRIWVNGQQQPMTLPIVAQVGDVVRLGGWAFDVAGNASVRELVAKIDNRATFAAQTQLGRPELAAVAGAHATESGFVVSIPTETLAPSLHRLFFVMTSGGVQLTSQAITLQLRDKNGERSSRRQFVVATAMKSGGRHVASVLERYLEIENPAWGPADDGEHIITDQLIEPALALPFVLGGHFMARSINVNQIAYWGLKCVVTWRNLGDIVVSLDDHTLKAAEGEWRNTYTFIEDRIAYAGLPDQKRYQFQIRNAIPWYLGFYLSWRLAQQPLFMRYEWMVSDEPAYFRYLIGQLVGSVDDERLAQIVAGGPTARSGFNVGRAGRSATALSEESQAMLEACIREHPSDIGELLFELPWYAAKYGPPAVVAAEDGAYLLAQGVKRRAGEHWLLTHGHDPARLRRVSGSELEGYRSGADLY